MVSTLNYNRISKQPTLLIKLKTVVVKVVVNRICEFSVVSKSLS